MTAPPLAPPDLKRYRSSTQLTMRATPTELPAGVIGQVEGIAIVYGVIDDRGTMFARGCLDRTVRERVAAGKVKLYVDHGDFLLNHGMYDTHLHIGTVRAVWDAQEPDGTWVSRFRADIFDTEAGRREHEYLKAVASTSSETGVSIGMLDDPRLTRATVNGVVCGRIDEVALREISITGEPAIPGTRVTHVRQEWGEVKDQGPDAAIVTKPFTSESFVTHSGLRFKVTTVANPEHATPLVTVEPVESPLSTDLLTPPNYFALLDGIVAHLGPDAVRAHLGATVSAGRDTDSNAGSGAPDSPDSDAATLTGPGVSQDGTEPSLPNVVPMAERLAWCRTELPRLYQ